MIVIQQLCTEWSKASRGEPGASARNSTPQALALPSIPHGDEFLHTAVLEEREGFRARTTFEGACTSSRRRPQGLDCRLDDDALHVRFVWADSVAGAPSRPASEQVRIPLGSWCRLLHNGRHADVDSGLWSYQSTVLNVAWVDEADQELFLNSSPITTVDQRRHLS